MAVAAGVAAAASAVPCAVLVVGCDAVSGDVVLDDAVAD